MDPSQPSLNAPQWVDLPGSNHDHSCGISFCDGHAEIKRWRDPIVWEFDQMEDNNTWEAQSPKSKFDQDVFWLANRSTALKTTQAFLGPQ
jgi:prepilin-type processing-associated H-X9-DG protein